MTALRSLVVGAALIASTALVGLLTSAAPADAQNKRPPTPVDIVSSVPLEVSGNIALAAGGSVNVGNPPSSPVPVRDVDEAAKELFQFGTPSSSFDGSAGVREVLTVPAGKRLVIEHFSALVNSRGPNGLAGVSVGIELTNHFAQAPCQAIGQATNGLNYFHSCAMPAKLYAEAGQKIVVVVFTNDGEGAFRAFVSGYFVPVP
jgi:hypothetical protein